MRSVLWTDANGWRHRSALRNDDPDDAAPRGLRRDPPSVERLDWDNIKRELHNQLVNRELFTYDDVIRQQTGLTGAVLAAVRRPLKELYRERRDNQQK